MTLPNVTEVNIVYFFNRQCLILYYLNISGIIQISTYTIVFNKIYIYFPYIQFNICFIWNVLYVFHMECFIFFRLTSNI